MSEINKMMGFDRILEVNQIIGLHKKGQCCRFPGKTFCVTKWKTDASPIVNIKTYCFVLFSDHSKFLKINMKEYKTVQTADPFHINLKGKRYR